MLEGIMMFYSENVWSSQFNKLTKRRVHWIIQVIGSLLALSGICIKYVYNDGKHFQTIHSTIGLISGIFLMISLCSGVIALKAFPLRNIVRPAFVKFLHYIVGSTAILLGWLRRSTILLSNFIHTKNVFFTRPCCIVLWLRQEIHASQFGWINSTLFENNSWLHRNIFVDWCATIVLSRSKENFAEKLKFGLLSRAKNVH